MMRSAKLLTGFFLIAAGVLLAAPGFAKDVMAPATGGLIPGESALEVSLPVDGIDGFRSVDTAGTVSTAEWNAWKTAFVTPDGRVVDGLSGGISHSEGQGYGMMLAYAAGDRAGFDLIWAFTRLRLALRDDGLLAWRWDPSQNPNVTDINNATDGDILVAYALTLAGNGWNNRSYRDAGADLVRRVSRLATLEADGKKVLLPGVEGFSADDQEDGPVVNPSYWVFEAFPIFAGIDPEGRWDAIALSGAGLLRSGLSGPAGVPADWVSIAGPAKPAGGFDPVFGYNAIRVPLYLVRAGVRDGALLGGIAKGMTGEKGALRLVNVNTGETTAELTDPGFVAVTELLSCVLRGDKLSPGTTDFEPTTYYPSTLHLLVLSYARKDLGQCL